MKSKKEKQKAKARQERQLAWVLREWDCKTLEDAINLAQEDSILHRVLRECGIQFNTQGSKDEESGR
jgi:hypothetical protein